MYIKEVCVTNLRSFKKKKSTSKKELIFYTGQTDQGKQPY